MSTVYNVGSGDENIQTPGTDLGRNRTRRRHAGFITTLTAVTSWFDYVFAMQCVSTVVVVRRETASWKWPFFQWLYMGVWHWVAGLPNLSRRQTAGLGLRDSICLKISCPDFEFHLFRYNLPAAGGGSTGPTAGDSRQPMQTIAVPVP